MEKNFSIFCDGGAIGNPGPAASAFVAYQDEEVISKQAKKIGIATNNVAEYQAVIAALEWLKNQSNNQQFNNLTISFFLDSQLLVNQLNGFYKIKNHGLRLLVIKVKALEQEVKGKIYYHHIPRTQNKLADALVKNALSG